MYKVNDIVEFYMYSFQYEYEIQTRMVSTRLRYVSDELYENRYKALESSDIKLVKAFV